MKVLFYAMLLLVTLEARATEVYRLDPVQTQVSFNVKRFGIPWVSAWFSDLSGAFVLDREGQDSRIDVVVRSASVHCWSSYWSAFLRSPGWLNTARFPEMVYRSSEVEFTDGSHALVHGQLSLHGQTRPVDLQVAGLECAGDAPKTCRFNGSAQIHRSEFGLPHGFWTGGDKVEILVHGAALP